MRLAAPWWLALIVLLPLLAYWGRQGGARLKYSYTPLLLPVQASLNPRFILMLLRCVALSLLIIALARPQAGRSYSIVTSDGVDIFLGIDTSASMRAMDFKLENEPVNRLAVVKDVVAKFIDQRISDRLGLIVFGDDAFTQSPLTNDHQILRAFLAELEIGMAGNATAIGSAIGVAVQRMKDLQAQSKILILLTDGTNTAGQLDPQTAADLAKKFGIKIYTIGVGTQGEAPFLVETPFGQSYRYDRVEIDEATLKDIAKRADGRYFRATETDELREIYQAIDQLEKTEIELKEFSEYEELFHYFLVAGLIILLLEIGLAQTRLRTLP